MDTTTLIDFWCKLCQLGVVRHKNKWRHRKRRSFLRLNQCSICVKSKTDFSIYRRFWRPADPLCAALPASQSARLARLTWKTGRRRESDCYVRLLIRAWEASSLVYRYTSLVMPLSENFQTKTKPIPTECQFGKPNTKPILYELQKTDICTKFLKVNV